MYISKAKKVRRHADGSYGVYDYYRLTQSYLDAEGRTRHRSVLCLGELEGFSKDERNELARMLTVMIEQGQSVISENRRLYETAMEMYVKYRSSRFAQENDPMLKAERERAEAERRRDLVTVRLSTLTQHEARTVGAEHLCNSTLQMLRIREYLSGRGWSRGEVNLALMQIVARALFPFSELKTVRYLRENTALSEIFQIPKERITKDALYESARRLWEVHRGLEDFLHRRVCSMFHLEEKILLFDITNTYFEGRMEYSDICRFGRSKEKRSDCKIVVLAAVVNTEGLLVRTAIYEGNRQDVTTLEEVIGSLDVETTDEARKIVVMDAGFYSRENVKWLTQNHFDYITVLPSGCGKFTPDDGRVVTHQDCRHQEIRLQKGRVEIDGMSRRALLVDSDAKALKEQSMYERACQCYEEGLEAIRSGIMKKGGTKRRDAVNNRLGKLDGKYGAIRRNYDVRFEYEGTGKKEIAVGMSWTRNGQKAADVQKFHGKYVLLTSLDGDSELNIWKFYNAIRTVEETFHTLKTDLDIRPVYHKTDGGIKAHLNLAVLGYWLVSVTKHRLKLKQYDNVRWDEIVRIANTQVMVTARMTTKDGDRISIRQATQPEAKLSAIYSLMGICPTPIQKVKSMLHPKPPLKNSE